MIKKLVITFLAVLFIASSFASYNGDGGYGYAVIDAWLAGEPIPDIGDSEAYTGEFIIYTTNSVGIAEARHVFVDGILYTLELSEEGWPIVSANALPEMQNLYEPTTNYPFAESFEPPVTNAVPPSYSVQVAEWTRQNDPGDTMALTAENLTLDPVFFQFYSVDGSGAGSIQRLDGRQAAVTLPDNLTDGGMYLMWPMNKNGFGEPVGINRTEAWWVGYDKPVVGETFSIYGRSLSLGSGSSWIWNDTTQEWLESVSENPYKADFVVPVGWTGTNVLYAHNGHGGKYGWSSPVTITVTSALGFSDDTNTWYDVTDYGLVGDGVTDNLTALNALWLTANDDAWPTLYFPTGTYLMGGTTRVQMQSDAELGCRLIGDGMDSSAILAQTTANVASIQFNNLDNLVIESMELAVADTGYNGESYDVNNCRNVIIQDSRLNSEPLTYKKYLMTGADVVGFRMIDSEWNAGEQMFFADCRQFFFSNVTFRAMWDLGGFGIGSVSEMALWNCDAAHYDDSDTSSGRGFGSGRWITMNSNAGDNLYVGDSVTTDMMPRDATDSFRDQPTAVGAYVNIDATYGSRVLTFADLTGAHGSKVTLRADDTTEDSIFEYDVLDVDLDADTVQIRITNWTTNSPTYGDAAMVTSSWFGIRDNPNQGGGEQIMREGGYATYHGYPTAQTSNTVTFADISSYLTGLDDSHAVIIIAGTGQGQMRVIDSQTSETLTLTSNWNVEPDATSVVAVGRFSRNWAIYNNTLDAKVRDPNYTSTAGVQFSAGGGHTIVIDGNTISETVTGINIDHPLKDVTSSGTNSWTPIYFLDVLNNTMITNRESIGYKTTEFEGVSDNRNEDEDGFLGAMFRGNAITNPINNVFGVNNNNNNVDLDNMGSLVIWDSNDIATSVDLYDEPILFYNEVFIGNTITGTGSPVGFNIGTNYTPSFVNNTIDGFAPNYSTNYAKLSVPVRTFYTNSAAQTAYVYSAGTIPVTWTNDLADGGSITTNGSDSFTFTATNTQNFTVSGGGDDFEIYVISGSGSGDSPDPETDYGDALVTLWETTTTNQTLVYPAGNFGTVDGWMLWETADGTPISTNTFTSYNDAAMSNTFATAGFYRCTVTGTVQRFTLSNGGSKLYLRAVENVGDVNMDYRGFYKGFQGALNMTNFTPGVGAELDVLTDITTAFYQYSYYAHGPAPDVSGMKNIEYAQGAFQGSGISTCPDLSGATNLTVISYMLKSCSQLDEVIAPSIRNVTAATGFLDDTTITEASYEEMWVAFKTEADVYGAQSGVTFGAGANTCSAASAGEAARAWFVSNYSWTVTDGDL